MTLDLGGGLRWAFIVALHNVNRNDNIQGLIPPSTCYKNEFKINKPEQACQ